MLSEAEKAEIRSGSLGGKPKHNPDDPDRRCTTSVRFSASTLAKLDRLINQDRSLSRGGIVRLALDQFLVKVDKRKASKIRRTGGKVKK
tara:strand:- start:973 stop:1239 length:267 start_codon:yes stop_codon:yes gene_type:complete